MMMGQIGCPETLGRNYHYSLRNNQEERISHCIHSYYVQNLFLRLGNDFT